MLGRVWVRVGQDHLSIIAAGVAFYGVFAIFPAVAALIAIYGLVADPADIRPSLQALHPLLPPTSTPSSPARSSSSSRPVRRPRPTTLISICVALWTARAGVMALIQGLNVVYREKDTRGIARQYLWALA